MLIMKQVSFKNTDVTFHLIKYSFLSEQSFSAPLGKKNNLKLEEERVLEVETLSQLFNTLFQVLYFLLIYLGFYFYDTGYLLVQMDEKESLDSLLSSKMAAFLYDAMTSVFSEAL